MSEKENDVLIPKGVFKREKEFLEAETFSAQQLKGIPRKGDTSLHFELPNQFGEKVNTKDLCKKGPLAIIFLRGLWCHNCNHDLLNLVESYESIKKLGAEVVVVSPGSERFTRSADVIKEKLPFSFLTDSNNRVAEKYRLRYEIKGRSEELYKEAGIDLSEYNAAGDSFLPIPAKFVLDRAGVVCYAKASPNPFERVEMGDILLLIEELTEGNI